MSTAPSHRSLCPIDAAGEPWATTHIGPPGIFRAVRLQELWRFRELAWALALRDLRVRYKQTLLGGAWAIIQPLAMMAVIHLSLGRGLGLADQVKGPPYPLFLLAGLLPWTLFASAVNGVGNSFIGNAHIVSKVYFPRLLLPISALVGPIVDHVIALSVLAAMMQWYGVEWTASLLVLPLIWASAILTMLGVGTSVAALTVAYRDLKHALPFVLQLWFFLTPVIFPSTLLPERLRWVVELNPMCGVIENFRAAVLGLPIDWAALAISSGAGVVILIIGLVAFHWVDRRVTDLI